MSLINDALKRARHEALRQDAEGQPRAYRAVPAHSRRPHRPWLPTVVGVGAIVVLGAGLLAVWPLLSPARTTDGGQDGIQAVDESRALPVEQAVGSESTAPGVPDPEVTVGAAVEAEPDEALPTVEAEPAVALIDDVRSDPVGDSDASPPPETDRRIASTPSGAASRLEAGATYLRRARSPDGSEVRLGGIAYSDTQPIAVINGSVVSPGDMIAGFTVVGIEPERVQLEADGVSIYLALH